MKFETPRININVFSENIVTAASGIANSDTVTAAKGVLSNPQGKNIDPNNILTFTID